MAPAASAPAPAPAAALDVAAAAAPNAAEVDLQNKYAEMESGAVALAAERDELKAEIAQLRRSNQLMLKESSSARAAAVDNEELKTLRSRLDTAQRDADARLHEVVQERARGAKVSSELQNKIADLEAMTHRYQEIRSKTAAAEMAVVPSRVELAAQGQAREAAEQKVKLLTAEISDLTQQRDRAFHEKTHQVQQCSREAQAARAEAAASRQAADEAQQARRAAEERAVVLERRLRELTALTSAERHAHERQLAVRDNQASQLDAALTAAKEQLEELASKKRASDDAEATLRQEHQQLLARAASSEQLRQLRAEGRTSLQSADVTPALPVAAGLPSAVLAVQGFADVSLVRELAEARDEAVLQRQARQQMQVTLHELEDEVRTKLPLFADQCREVARLREERERMLAQGEELRQAALTAEEGSREAQDRAERAERSEQILECHAREMAHQLGIMVEAMQQRDPPAGCATKGATISVTSLTEQNEELRKSVARLTDQCETAAQRELQAMREEHEQRASRWRQQVEEKDAQVAALSQQLQHHLSVTTTPPPSSTSDAAAASAAAGTAAAKSTSAVAGAPGDAAVATTVAAAAVPAAQGQEVAKLREQLRQMRAQFTKCVESLHGEVRELRSAELEAHRRLVEAQGRLAAELSRGGEAAVRAERASSSLKVQCSYVHTMEAKGAAAEDALRKEEERLRQLEAELGQTRRECAQLEKQFQLEQRKVAQLAQDNSRLLEEKVTNAQVTVDLQAQMAMESDVYRLAKKDLQASTQSESTLLRDQLELSTKRQGDLTRSVDELNSALAARAVELQEVKARAKDAEASGARLEVQVAQREAEVQELRSAGVARPRRGSSVASEAAARLAKRARLQPPDEGRSARPTEALERELQLARGRQEAHAQSAAIWKRTLTAHEQDLKKQQEERAEHLEMLEKRGAECDSLKGELQQCRGQVQGFEVQVKASQEEVAALQAALEKARQEAREVEEKAKQGSAADTAEEWRRKHLDTVKEYSTCLRELAKTREAKQSMDQRVQELQLAVESLERRGLDGPLGDGGGPGEARAGTVGVADEDLRGRQLEAEKSRFECETVALRAQVRDLHVAVLRKGEQVEGLQAEAQRGRQAASKLGRLSVLEGENKRLVLETTSLQRQVSQLQQSMDVLKVEKEPLLRDVTNLRRKEQALQSSKADLERKLELERRRRAASEAEGQKAAATLPDAASTTAGAGAAAAAAATPAAMPAAAAAPTPATPATAPAASSSASPAAAGDGSSAKTAPPAAPAPAASSPAASSVASGAKS